jgi:hypothetical protein
MELELPPPPPPATTSTFTEVTPAGTVQLRTVYEPFPPVVMSVTNETTQSPFTTVTITPAELSTVDAQKPDPMLAAFAFLIASGVDETVTAKDAKRMTTAVTRRKARDLNSGVFIENMIGFRSLMVLN